MKIIVTGTRGIPDVMGGVETHCEELFPRIARRGEDVTVIRRKNYVHDGLTEWNGVKLIDIESPKQKSFYKPQNKMFHFCKTFCSKITLVNTIQNVILNPI